MGAAALFDRDVAGLDHLFPAVVFLALECGELFGGVGHHLEADRGELIANLLGVEGFDERIVGGLLHGRWQALGRDDGLPGRDFEFETPASASVGTSGSTAERFGLVMARARILPALMYCTTELMFWNEASTWPPMRSVWAGAPPL